MTQTQVWLITGASRGIGLELAKAALKAGHKVVACYRSKAKLGSTFAEVEALGGTWLQLDVAAEDVESKVQSVVAEHGHIDVLINSAGYGMHGSIEDTSVDQIDAIFKTNFVGSLRTIQAALPSMRSRRSGTIVNISSSLGVNPAPGFGIYSATKFALEAATEALQAELSGFSIRVLLVEPGKTATEFAEASGTGVEVALGSAYEGSAVQYTRAIVRSAEYRSQSAPPAAVAQRIVEAVDRAGVFAAKEVGLRLPLGADTREEVERRAAVWEGLGRDMKDAWMSIYA